MDYLLRDSLHAGVQYGKYDLERLVRAVTLQDVQAKQAQVNEMFQISGDSPYEPLARAPSAVPPVRRRNTR